MERRSSNTKPACLHHGSATQAQSISESHKTAILSQKTNLNQAQFGNLKFFGEFQKINASVESVFGLTQRESERQHPANQEHGEPRSCIVSNGVLTNGQYTLFTGLVDINFENFYGLKYDPNTEYYTMGRFSKDLKLESFGIRTDGIDEYHSKFANGNLEGLSLWLEYR